MQTKGSTWIIYWFATSITNLLIKIYYSDCGHFIIIVGKTFRINRWNRKAAWSVICEHNNSDIIIIIINIVITLMLG